MGILKSKEEYDRDYLISLMDYFQYPRKEQVISKLLSLIQQDAIITRFPEKIDLHELLLWECIFEKDPDVMNLIQKVKYHIGVELMREKAFINRTLSNI